MYRVKQLFGGHLTLRDYDAQVGEAMAMIRALNKMMQACLKVCELPEEVTERETFYLKTIYSTKPKSTNRSAAKNKQNSVAYFT